MMISNTRMGIIVLLCAVSLLLTSGLGLISGCGEDKTDPGGKEPAGTTSKGSGSTTAVTPVPDPASQQQGNSGTSTTVTDPVTKEPSDDGKTPGDSPAVEPKPVKPKHSWLDETGNVAPRSEMVLKLGRNPFLQTRLMLRVHEPLLDYLAKKLGVKSVKLVLAEDYAGIVQYLSEGKIDIAWIGTVAYVSGREKAGARPVVRPVRFGKDTYGSIIITRADNSINSVQDLKGKTFAFVDKESASGYLFPLAYMLGEGVNPEKDFKKIDYLKEHDSVVMAVFFKKFTAGAVYDDARDKLGKENKGQLKILARIPDIPNEPIVVHPDMPDDLVEDIKQAFIALGKDPEFLKDFNSRINDRLENFVEASNEEYDVVRELLNNLEEKQKADGQ